MMSHIRFPLSIGSNFDNEMNQYVRFAWENKNIDVHSLSISKMIDEFIRFKRKLMYNDACHINNLNSVMIDSVTIMLSDISIIGNKNFDGKVGLSIDPKKYDGPPFLIEFTIDATHDVENIYKAIINTGYFYLKGEGELDYVDEFDVTVMRQVKYCHITEFKINQICFYNTKLNTSTDLFK